MPKPDKKKLGRKWRKHLLSVNYPPVGKDTEEETILKTFFQDSTERKCLIKWVALELKYITDVAATLDHVGEALCCHGMLDEEMKEEFLYAKCPQEEQEEMWRLIFAMLRFSKFTPDIEPLEIEEKCLALYEDLNIKFLDLCSKGRKSSGVNLPTDPGVSKEDEKISEALNETIATQSTEDCEQLGNSSDMKHFKCSVITKIEKQPNQFNMTESKSKVSCEKSSKNNYVRYKGRKVDADNLPFVYIPKGAPLSLDSIDSNNLKVKVKTIPREINDKDLKELHKAQDILKSFVQVMKANMETSENNGNEEKLDGSAFSLHNSLTRYNRILDNKDEGATVSALENIEPTHLSLETMSSIHSMYQEKKCPIKKSLGQESDTKRDFSEEHSLS